MNKLGFFVLGLFLQFHLVINLSGQTISGTVFSEFSEPLAGASIWIRHTNIGTVTDYKGNYTITNDSNYKNLKYCLIGFECQEVAISKDTIINITLEVSPTELNEIIIYGIQILEKRVFYGIAASRRKGLFTKSKTIICGKTDSTLNRLESERITKLKDSIDIHVIPFLNDSINFIENLSPVEKNFRKYIIDSISYSEFAKDNGLQGIVIAIFTIDEYSKISNISIRRSVDPSLDNEVISILQQMPNEIQTEFGKYGNFYKKQIPKKYTIKFSFRLK